MSQWNKLDMDTKIAQVLNVQSHEPNHHFGRPFLTPYQIAIKFEKMFASEFQTINKPVGGKGTGQQDSLAQYIAHELSRRIKSGDIVNIEGRFLHCANLRSLEYEDDNGQLIASSAQQAYDLSMFRLTDSP